MTETIGQGTSRTEGTTQHLHYELSLPHPVENVWAAVATPEGLPGWLAAADVFEPRLDGAVTLRWLNGEPDAVHSGRITAWDPDVVAEYTIDLHGRCRFHLEPAVRHLGTTLRFTNEFDGDDALRLDCLAGWHHHFEFLAEALDGRPKDWSTWNLDRWRQLRETYAATD
ncbi:SRPBCC domain-containing protein [Streptomyces sp. G44]|uniref:SRPBCC domain-containing protein n=1 Tax=Streptomyces sp. G44 TaxID=2807632 RepID=UPI0019612DAF|nr:SRPBCC domain-containing protein [Streptomyces sp. G44]MBM7170521.1 SRPBCC domain-containing protein [Streptomyces sp. G44]